MHYTERKYPRTLQEAFPSTNQTRYTKAHSPHYVLRLLANPVLSALLASVAGVVYALLRWGM